MQIHTKMMIMDMNLNNPLVITRQLSKNIKIIIDLNKLLHKITNNLLIRSLENSFKWQIMIFNFKTRKTSKINMEIKFLFF